MWNYPAGISGYLNKWVGSKKHNYVCSKKKECTG